MAELRVVPLPTSVEVLPGDDVTTVLLEAIADAGIELVDGDVVCVASKVVAKAEGAFVPLPAGLDPDDARRLLAREQACLLYTSPSPRDQRGSRMPSSA